MQAQTTRTFSGNFQKLAGGLIITAALAVGAIGLTHTDRLDFTGSGNDTAQVSAPSVDTHVGPRHGEGLLRAEVSSASVTEQVSISRQMDAPQGEGYLRSSEIPEVVARPAGQVRQTHQVVAPQGEGLPLIELEQSAQQFRSLGEGLVMGSGQ